MTKISQLPTGTVSSEALLPIAQPSGSTYSTLQLALKNAGQHVGYIQESAGAARRTVQSKLRESLSFFDFGAVGDNNTDDTAAINACIAAHLSTGIPIEAGEGTFFVSGQILIDVAGTLALTGIKIRGAGRRRTIIRSTYNAGVPFFLTASTGGAFYHDIQDMGFEGNYAGPVFQVGKNDFSDAFNSCRFTGLNVNNASQNAGAETVRLNFVLQSDIEIVAGGGGSGNPIYPTAPGYGKAVVLRQVQFSTLRLGCGNANVGLQMTGGVTYANFFNAIDIEEVDTGLLIDVNTASTSIFSGGVIVAKKCIASNPSGAAHMMMGMLYSPYTGGSIIDGTKNTGITIVRPGFSEAVNQAQLLDALPGGSANIRARGPDANIRLSLAAKGTGATSIDTEAGEAITLFQAVAGSVNYINMVPALTGARVGVVANGTDTNVGLRLANKGTAILELGGQTTATSATGGAASSLPAAPLGYLSVVINGTAAKIPYYAS